MLITNWLPHIIIFDSRGAPLARFESANLIALNRQLSAPSHRRPRLVNATGSKGSSHPYDPIALARSPVRLLDGSPEEGSSTWLLHFVSLYIL